jgi:hypothetical protein
MVKKWLKDGQKTVKSLLKDGYKTAKRWLKMVTRQLIDG